MMQRIRSLFHRRVWGTTTSTSQVDLVSVTIGIPTETKPFTVYKDGKPLTPKA